MSDTPTTEHHDDDYIHPFARKFLFLGEERVIESFIWLPVVGLAVTIPLALLYPFEEGHKAPWDLFPSWAIIGFVAYAFVVLSAEPLFRLLARKENYYGEEVVPENIIEPVVEGDHHD